MARYERLDALVTLLERSREPISMTALCAELEVSRATVNRLIGFLRTMRGADVDYDREQQGYVLRRGPHQAASLRLLGADGAEIAGLLEAQAILEQIPPGLVRTDTQRLRSGLEKLRQQHIGNAKTRDRVRLQMNHLRKTSESDFAVLLAGLQARRRLRIHYRSRNEDAQTQRVCSPIRLTLYRSNWYLAAWCHKSEALRVFSVDRISQARTLQEAAFEPDTAEVTRQLDSSYGIYPGAATQTAVLQFTPLAARWVADEEWHPQAQREAQADGGVVVRVPYHHDTELVMEILRHGGNCEVLAPPALRKSVKQALRAAAARYR